MTHWLAEQMTKGMGPFDVGTLVGPDGTLWSVGDKVYCGFGGYPVTEIELIIPGEGDEWRPRPPGGDCDAVWFKLSNGCYARPWLLHKMTPCMAAPSKKVGGNESRG